MISEASTDQYIYAAPAPPVAAFVVADPLQNQSLSGTSAVVISTQYVSACLFPILLALCTIGNILNIYVLLRYPKIYIKELLLLSLAVSDLLVMWIAFPRYLDHHQSLLAFDMTSTWFAISTMGVFTWLQYTFQTTSDFILVLFSIERLAAFRFSEPHRSWRTRLGCGLLVVVCVVVVSAALMSEHVVFYYMIMLGRGPEPHWLIRWYTIQQLTDVLLPLIVTAILLFLNTWLILHVTKLHNWTKLELRRFTNSVCRTLRQKDTRRLAKMNQLLLGCVLMYFVTQLPVMISNVVDYFSANHSLSGFAQAQPIIWIISLVNYSANFLVYMGFSRNYRESFFQLIKRIRMNCRRTHDPQQPRQSCDEWQTTPVSL